MTTIRVEVHYTFHICAFILKDLQTFLTSLTDWMLLSSAELLYQQPCTSLFRDQTQRQRITKTSSRTRGGRKLNVDRTAFKNFRCFVKLLFFFSPLKCGRFLELPCRNDSKALEGIISFAQMSHFTALVKQFNGTDRRRYTGRVHPDSKFI